MSIFLEAIQRFFEPQTVSNPMLILIVGCCGLASNLVGLFLFHDHGHSHGEHGEQRASSDSLAEAEAGMTNGKVLASTDKVPAGNSTEASDGDIVKSPTTEATSNANAAKQAASARAFSRSDEDHSTAVGTTSPTSFRKTAPMSSQRAHRRQWSNASRPRHTSFEEMHVHPASFRNEIIQAGRLEEIDSGASTDAEPVEPESGASSPTEDSRLLRDRKPPYTTPDTTLPLSDDAVLGKDDAPPRLASIEHHHHKHRLPASGDAATGAHGSSGHGHSHEDLNMRGVFLHVLGDALGNLGVIAAALFIWLTTFSWRFYADPLISLLITLIILKTALPLCRASARILLQAVPAGLSVDDVRDDIEALPGVVAAHHLHVWQLSGQKLVASLHVRLACDFPCDGTRGARQYMRLAKAVRTCLHEYGIHSSTIQPEFCLDARHDHTLRAQDDGDADIGSGSSGGNGGEGSGSGVSPRDDGGSARGTSSSRNLRIRTAVGSGKQLAGASGGSSPQDACLLECDEACRVKKCCVSPAERSDGGHRH